ncbi:MAG: hypothetical protein HY938_00555 [Nitrosomonadales bacterium]|nr:hypothetical protein [Nitrosomonadales bacterium]
MVMLVILIIGAAVFLVKALNSSEMKQARQKHNAEVLAQAKDALIGYAITYGDTHTGQVYGYLPCPDFTGGNPEGSAEASCGTKNLSQLGRLPWRTLGLPPLVDGDKECLWYAVSGTYKNNPKTDFMNWDTNGQLQAYASDGTTRLDGDDNQVVAVIFAPGATQNNQSRGGGSAPVCGGNYNASDYLDNDTVHGINNADVVTGHFVQGRAGGDINDQFIFITKQELWAAMVKRPDFINNLKGLAFRVAGCLADYGLSNPDSANKSLPWPAPLVLSDYAVNNNYDDSPNTLSGRVPYKVNTSNGITNNDMIGDILMPNMPNNNSGNGESNGLNCPYSAANPTNDFQRLYPWWDNWKDHLFYVISYEYRPKNSDTNSCGNCVSINGSGDYAGLVILAGSGLAGQVRASVATNNSSRGVLGNYLEGRNASNHPNSNGNADYQTQAASSTFNDTVYCIDTNLNPILCP